MSAKEIEVVEPTQNEEREIEARNLGNGVWKYFYIDNDEPVV